jgi:hypothetical protein
MRGLLIMGAACAAALGLSGCAMAGGGSNAALTQFNDTLGKIASDPRCGHTDRLQGNLGGLTGNNLSVFLERTCPPATPAPAPGPGPEPAPTS